MADLRRISEDEPAWAGALHRSIEELERRLSGAERDMPGGKQYHLYGEHMSPVTATEAEQRRLQRSRTVYPEHLNGDIEDGRDHFNTQGQPRSRADALYRKASAKLAAMEKMMARMGRQPSADERNEIATARHRADGIYAALGRQTPHILPGESPIAFRHRLAAGLRDMSPGLERANIDAIPAGAFSVVEAKIYRDAASAAHTGAGIPAGTLNPHVFTDETGHNRTEYNGDNRVTWAPFTSAGARVKFNRKLATAGEQKRWAL